MPATWKMYGVDANRDGKKDPFNPVDAIFAAARYLRAAGGDQDIRRAIFAYNHADWYVDSVLLRARVIGGIPSNLVGSLTGLTQGRFPVHSKATYADDISERDIKQLKGEGNKARRRRVRHHAPRDQDLLAQGRRRDRRQRRPRSPRSARASASAATSSSRTSTATRTRTRTWPRSPSATRRRRTQKVSKREIKKELELPAEDLPPTVEASGSEGAGRPRAEAEGRREGRAARHQAGRPRRAADRQGRQGAPVRQPAAQERRRRRRRPAGVRAHGPHRRRGDVPGLPEPRLRPRPQRRAAEAAQEGLAASSPARSSAASARRRRTPRRTRCSRSGPPAAAPRGSTRSRSSTAGSCSSRPRSTAPPARTRSSARSPAPRRSARSC